MTDMQDGFGAQFEAARQRGTERLRGPHAVAVRYDAGRGRVVVTLSSGVELGLLPRDVEGLAGASAADLRVVEVDAMGFGIHFPQLDADLYVPALLEGCSGHGAGWRPALARRVGSTVPSCQTTNGSGDTG